VRPATEAPPQSKSAGLWGRLLAPSISDFFFVSLIAWTFLSGGKGWQLLLTDADTGIHIRIGDYILATHTIPTHDLFGFSKPHGIWYAFEWLSEVIFSALHSGWGLKGLTLFCGVLIAAYLTSLLRYMIWSGANSILSLFLTLLTATATAIHFHARPHLFTLVLLAASIWIIAADRRSSTRWLWVLIPLVVLWANLHGGFVVFFAYLGLLVIGCALEGKFDRAIRYSVLGVAAAIASLVNPYGYRLHQHIIETLGSSFINKVIDEFKSPSFRGEALQVYMLLLIAGLALCGLLLAQRKIAEALWIAFFASASLTSVRHVPLYVLVAAPIIAVELTRLWQLWSVHQPRNSTAAIMDGFALDLRRNLARTSVWAAVFVGWLAVTPSIAWPTDLAPDFFPTGMLQRHRELLISSRLFASDQWNEYILYHNYPRQQIFVDSRYNYYGDKIGNDYLRINQAQYTYQTLLDRYNINLVLCPIEEPIATVLKLTPAWVVLDDDGKNILLQRKQN
jgi:hypothetical protein